MSNNKMLIDSSHPEETRVAMVRGNRVDEFDFESEHKTQLRGNIYLAKVTRVEPSLQAAFVDYGGNRHGFLAFSEIHPDYYQIPMADRQALLDAEAEDARLEAEAQAIEDEDDAGEDIEADAKADDDEQKEKPPRKRRTRRRSKKSAEAAEADSDGEALDSDPDSNETKSEESDAVASEEDDDTLETMNADNDGDDVVSEPAAEAEPKPKKRRTSRKKAESAEEETKEIEAEAAEKPKKKRTTSRAKKAKAEEPVVEEAPAAATEEEKPKKRRTTRRKKTDDVAEEIAADESVSEVAESPDDEAEKPKKRRPARRKKKDTQSEDESAPDAETAAESKESDADQTASEPDGSDDEEEKPKRTRGRRRSRGRSRKKNQEDNGNNDDDGENGRVEAVGAEDALEEVPTRRTSRRHYKIQEVIKRRQILLVQVVKEERGNKGAALTTYLSLAGRYSVLMPNTARGGGISRKITNAADRKRLKAIAGNLDVPAGMGVILRTAGASRDKAEVQRDFEYLLRLWENVRTLTLESTAPCLTYEEGSLIKRSIRDLYDKDTGEIMVAGEAGYREAKDFMAMLMPEHAKNVKLYKDRVPLFAKMGVEAQLDAMLQPQVTLKSGGYLVINQTEALVAIDVNSGRSTRQHSIEETATQTNLEAADEVARQLRLRDLAGLIVIDFIDMEERRNNRAVEKRLKDALKHDRARIQVGRISHFGLMEMSRQRIRASVLESTTQVCPTCDGVGHVRAASSVVLGVLRSIEEQLNKNARNNLTVKVRAPTALYLLNNKRENLSDLETRFRVAITIEIDDTIGLEPCVIERGELAYKPSGAEEAVQPDTISPDETSSNDVSDQPATDNVNEQSGTADDNGNDGNRPKRRRRRRKRRSEEETSSDVDAVQSDEKATEAAETKNDDEVKSTDEESAEKKPSRQRRTKKNADEAREDAKVVTDEKADSEPDSKEKPKRRTRRAPKPKIAAEEAVTDAVSEAPTSDDGKGDESGIEPKPKRRTTRRKASEDSETPATSPDTKAESPDGDEPKKEGWWRRKFF